LVPREPASYILVSHFKKKPDFAGCEVISTGNFFRQVPASPLEPNDVDFQDPGGRMPTRTSGTSGALPDRTGETSAAVGIPARKGARTVFTKLLAAL
jgi:hypothetical protein